MEISKRATLNTSNQFKVVEELKKVRNEIGKVA
jgi:hypothetical protein